MSFGTRIVALIALLTLVGSALLLAGAGRSFDERVDRLGALLETAVVANPSLAYEVYRGDADTLESSLAAMLATWPGADAILVASTGAQLARFGSSGAAIPEYSSELLRGNASVGQVVTAAIDDGGDAAGLGFWSALFSQRYLAVSAPIFTGIDPNRSGLTAADFSRAAGGASIVIGYVEAAADAGALAMPVLMAVVPGMLALWVLAAAGIVLALRWTRQVTPPTVALQALTQQLRRGDLPESIDLGATGDFEEIEAVIGQIVGALRRRDREIDDEAQKLTLKADENASQLSARERELRQANEEITRARDRLHRASYYDSLTSLPNRALFTEQFRQMLRLRERDERPLALLLVNLGDFKRINESLGRNIGDLLLTEVAGRLKESVRESDVVATAMESGEAIDMARIGGSEFALVLNQLEQAEAAGAVGQRLVDALADPVVIDTHEIAVPVSVGIALAPTDGEDLETLMRAAATAVQHGLEDAGASVKFFSDDMAGEGADRLLLESELRKAIERGQLQLHYQPQVDTFDGAIVGAEALLRWQHPELGAVPPYQFIPLAEKMGLIGELDDWVVAEACSQLARFRADGLELARVAVNVSAIDFSPRFVSRVRDVLQATGLPASSLELGLSEGVLLENSQEINRCLGELSSMGVYLSLDGFGTGGAPLACLSRYDLDEMKLDRTFVIDCDSRADNGRLAQGLVGLARSLDMRILAEGVESEAEYRFLSGHGVRIMQGYLFSKPVPAAELAEQLSVPWFYAASIQRMALTQ